MFLVRLRDLILPRCLEPEQSLRAERLIQMISLDFSPR